MLRVIELSNGTEKWSIGFGSNMISLSELSNETGISESILRKIKKVCRGHGNKWIFFSNRACAQSFVDWVNEKTRRK